MQAATIMTDHSARQNQIQLMLFGLVVAYAALLLSTFFMGIWLVGRGGQPVAADFISFWAAGKLVLQGHAADAYDWAIHKNVAMREAGTAFGGRFTFQYPPTFLVVTPLLGLMPYPLALLAWMAFGVALYLVAVRLIHGNWNATIAALAWPAVLWNMVVGQNGFVIAALLGGGVALIERRPAIAGILFGLLTFKPQFGLLIPVALIAGGHWRVIGFAALSAVTLAAASAAILGSGPWIAFIESALRINDAILVEGGTDFSKLQSLYGYLRSLGFGGSAAWSMQGLLILLLGGLVAWLWRRDTAFGVRAAALATATILASPYSFIYDFVALAIPLVFLGRCGFSRNEMAILVMAGLLVGWGPSSHLATALVASLLVMGLVVGRALAGAATPATAG